MKGMKIISICHLYIRFWINNRCKVLSKKANELFQTCYAVPYFSLLEGAFLGISNTTLLPLEATFFLESLLLFGLLINPKPKLTYINLPQKQSAAKPNIPTHAIAAEKLTPRI